MTPRESPFPNYPVFQPLFEQAEDISVPLYLTLLNLGRGSEKATARLRQILKDQDDLTPQITALFDDFNWRPQLVGAVALGLGITGTKSRAALWRAFDSGSWVSPQLAAIASLVDEDFEQQARTRIAALCPINQNRLEGLNWIVRHSAAGPISFAAHSSKALSALAALCQQSPAALPWLDPLLVREDIRRSLESDTEGGGRIATSWREEFLKLVGHSGQQE